MGSGQLVQRPHRHVDALERLDAPDEQQHGVVVETERGEGLAGAALVAGREEGVVDTGRHDLDALGTGAVERDELGRLGRAGGEDGVGAGDDLRLGLDPPGRLGIARLGLDPGERVERRHQRQRRARA